MRFSPDASHLDLVAGLSMAVDLMDPALHDHHRRVAFIAREIGATAGRSPEEIRMLGLAGLLHDVGALSLSERLEMLSFEETRNDGPGRDWHAEVGYQLLKGFAPLREVARVIRFHHIEWWSGRGATHRGRAVPANSHLIHLADRIAVSIKPGQEILGQVPEIRNRIREHRGKMFVPQLVDAFLDTSARESFWLQASARPELDPVPGAWESLPLERDSVRALTELFSQIVDFRSRFTATHTVGVAASARALGRLGGLPEEECGALEVAGHLHDLGKLAIPVEVLEKPAPLSPGEINLMRSHSYHTFRILKASGVGEDLTAWAADHHERLDGAGYPFHRRAEDLSPQSRLLAVADVFTALTETRPYRAGMLGDMVSRLLRRLGKDRALDPEWVSLLMAHFDVLDAERSEAQAGASRLYESFWGRVGSLSR